MSLTRVRSQLISVPTNYPITGSLSGTASYATTASFAMNGGSGGGGTLQTGSIANQTVLYNVTTSQDNTITGLNLLGNKWGISVVEEWNSGSIVGDDNYSSVGVLLHFSGSNGSTTFTDNSSNSLTVTSNNGAAISTAQSKFGGSSVYFDGTNDYLSIVANNAFNISTGDFTVEFWYRPISVSGGWACIISHVSYQSAGWALFQYTNQLRFYYPNAFAIITTGVLSADTWHHIALVRYGSGASSLILYVDGVNQGYGNYTWTNSSQVLAIGGITSATGWDANYLTNAYIDELRITKGVARYTGSFTPPTSEFLNNSAVTQYSTKYIGLVGGLNDSTVDYGIEKLSDTSLKIRKMSASGQPLSGSGQLSSSVDRVYVNVLNYDNVSISGSINNAITSSYALTSSYTSGVGSINDTQLAKAWVNFNGTGTVAIRGSYNVSSITDNATGQYYVNFSTPMNNTNYAVLGTVATSISNFEFCGAGPDTVNRCFMGIFGGSFKDQPYVQVLVFSN